MPDSAPSGLAILRGHVSDGGQFARFILGACIGHFLVDLGWRRERLLALVTKICDKIEARDPTIDDAITDIVGRLGGDS